MMYCFEMSQLFFFFPSSIHLEQYYEQNVTSWNLKVTLNYAFGRKDQNIFIYLFIFNKTNLV